MDTRVRIARASGSATVGLWLLLFGKDQCSRNLVSESIQFSFCERNDRMMLFGLFSKDGSGRHGDGMSE